MMEHHAGPQLEKIGITAVLPVTLMIFLLSTVVASSSLGVTRDRVIFGRDKTTVFAERADSPEKKARGLMFRTSLAEKEGMIFGFDESTYQTFWMYNTKIPLTIIFLDENLRIVDIQDMQPCLEKKPDRCRTYTSRNPARYAIEVSLGFARKHGIRVGEQATIERGQ